MIFCFSWSIDNQLERQEGFIPHSYCAHINTQLADLAIKKKLPREAAVGHISADLTDGIDMAADIIMDDNTSGLLGLQSSLKHSQASLSSEPDFIPFAKDPSGRYIVLYTFIARDENDVSVERGEFVTVLNREDPEWFWIVRSDGQEGFIPSGFVYPAENILQGQVKSILPSKNMNNVVINGTGSNNNTNSLNLNSLTNNGANITQQQQQQQNQQHQQPAQQQVLGSDDLRYHGTELVMLYDYKVIYSIYFLFRLYD